MAYPVLSCGQDLGGAVTPIDDITIDRATNGAPRGRGFHDALRREFKIVHEPATMADKAALDAFYTANRLTSFTFVSDDDGVGYTCIFAGPPVPKRLAGPLYSIAVTLVQL